MADLKQLMDEACDLVYKLNNVEVVGDASKGVKKFKELIINQIKDALVNEKLHSFKLSEIDDLIQQYDLLNYYEPLYDGNIKELKEIMDSFVLSKDSPIDVKIDRLSRIIYQELFGLSIIEDLADAPAIINEIGCNGPYYVWVEVSGVKQYLPKFKFRDEKHFEEIIRKATSYGAKSDINDAEPEILCQRPDGSRVTALFPPYSGYGQLNIRKFDIKFKSKEELIRIGTSSEEFETFLDNIAPGRPNLLIIGDQATGKSTYLLRYIDSIPDYLAIATIETAFELNADLVYGDRKNIVKLQVLDNKSIEDAFATCLRLGRDIIITGEIREPAEALVTLKSMLRQGRGSCGTFHSTSTRGFIYDLRNLLLQSGYYTNERLAEFDVARAVDIVIHLKKNSKTGKRFIKEVCEIIVDYDNYEYTVKPLFKYDMHIEKLVPVSKPSKQLLEKMMDYEISEDNLKIIRDIFSVCEN